MRNAGNFINKLMKNAPCEAQDAVREIILTLDKLERRYYDSVEVKSITSLIASCLPLVASDLGGPSYGDLDAKIVEMRFNAIKEATRDCLEDEILLKAAYMKKPSTRMN